MQPNLQEVMAISPTKKTSPLHHRLNVLLISFWAVWLVIVSASDLCNLLVYFDWLEPDFPFNSNNFAAVQKMMGRYKLSDIWSIFLFAGIISWCLINAALFMAAIALRKQHQQLLDWAGQGYLMLIALHICFDIADELFIFYEFADGLMSRLGTIILCYLCLWLERQQQD